MTTKLTKKETCERLKAEIKADTEAIRAHKAEGRKIKEANRALINARKATGEVRPEVSSGEINEHRLRHTNVSRVKARHRLLAYAYLRGKTYREVEPKCDPSSVLRAMADRYRIGISTYLADWEGAEDCLQGRLELWLSDGTTTRFELEKVLPVEESSNAVGPVEPPRKMNLLDKLRSVP